jgi:hypothetical protein
LNDYFKQISEPSEDAKKEALKTPNGYVYVIDKQYQGKDNVPSDAILGAWKVNDKGIIVGTFLPNPNYKTKLS